MTEERTQFDDLYDDLFVAFYTNGSPAYWKARTALYAYVRDLERRAGAESRRPFSQAEAKQLVSQLVAAVVVQQVDPGEDNQNAYRDARDAVEAALATAKAEVRAEPSKPTSVMNTDTVCSQHPDAPHGFNRSASINEDRYVCDCEGWVPPDEVRAEPVAKDWPHIANEWCDMSCNGIQWLRNIQEGISTPDEALAEMRSNFARIQALSAAPPSANVLPETGRADEQKLSQEKILQLWDTHVGDFTSDYPFGSTDVINFARAIERAVAALTAQGQPAKAAPDDVVRDAARYRWLRDDENEWEPFDSAWLCKVDLYGQEPKDMDEYIDKQIAAIARTASGKAE